MNIEAIQAEITRLQALLGAQEAPIAEEIEIDLPDTTATDCRAANFEPLSRGSRLAKNPSVTLGGATGSCSHSAKLRKVVPMLALMVEVLGPSFKATEAKRYMAIGVTTPGGIQRWKDESSANTWLSGAKARILAEAPELVQFSGTKPETWVVNLHELAKLSR
jgi:hypothetical protein